MLLAGLGTRRLSPGKGSRPWRFAGLPCLSCSQVSKHPVAANSMQHLACNCIPAKHYCTAQYSAILRTVLICKQRKPGSSSASTISRLGPRTAPCNFIPSTGSSHRLLMHPHLPFLCAQVYIYSVLELTYGNNSLSNPLTILLGLR